MVGVAKSVLAHQTAHGHSVASRDVGQCFSGFHGHIRSGRWKGGQGDEGEEC